MPDWEIRVSSLDGGTKSRIELVNPCIGEFLFYHYLYEVDGRLMDAITYDFCCTYEDCSQAEIDYRKTLETRFKELFPGE